MSSRLLLLALLLGCTAPLPQQPARDNPFDPDADDESLRPTLALAGDSLVVTWQAPESELVTGIRLYQALRESEYEPWVDLPATATCHAAALTPDQKGRRLGVAVTVFNATRQSDLHESWSSTLRTPPLLVNPYTGNLFTNDPELTLQLRCDGAQAMKLCVGRDSSEVAWGAYQESTTVSLPPAGGYLPLDAYFRLPGGLIQTARDSVAFDASCEVDSSWIESLGASAEPFGLGESFRLHILLSNDGLGVESGASLVCEWPGEFTDLPCVEEGDGQYCLDYTITTYVPDAGSEVSVTGSDRAGNIVSALVSAPLMGLDDGCSVGQLTFAGMDGAMPPYQQGDLLRFTVQLETDGFGPETGAQVHLEWPGVSTNIPMAEVAGGAYQGDLSLSGYYPQAGAECTILVFDRAGHTANMSRVAPTLAQDGSCTISSVVYSGLHGAVEPFHTGDSLLVQTQLEPDAWGPESGATVTFSWPGVVMDLPLSDLGVGVYSGWLRIWAPAVGAPMTITAVDRAAHVAQLNQAAPDVTLLPVIHVQHGEFAMGQVGVAEPVHTVTLTHDFLLGTTEVTNQQYLAFLQWAVNHHQETGVSATASTVQAYGVELVDLDSPSCQISFNQGVFSLEPVPQGVFQGLSSAQHPMMEVSWYGAACFCDWLSLVGGLPPYYNGRWSRIPSPDNPYAATGWRLPTEAEWEYAARFNNGRSYPWGETIPTPCVEANFSACVGFTSPVGQYPTGASQLGFQDLAGNVWEWCNDWYASYSAGAATNPAGAVSGLYRVIRGGSWFNLARYCRSADRSFSVPSERGDKIGFRIARILP